MVTMNVHRMMLVILAMSISMQFDALQGVARAHPIDAPVNSDVQHHQQQHQQQQQAGQNEHQSLMERIINKVVASSGANSWIPPDRSSVLASSGASASNQSEKPELRILRYLNDDEALPTSTTLLDKMQNSSRTVANGDSVGVSDYHQQHQQRRIMRENATQSITNSYSMVDDKVNVDDDRVHDTKWPSTDSPLSSSFVYNDTSPKLTLTSHGRQSMFNPLGGPMPLRMPPMPALPPAKFPVMAHLPSGPHLQAASLPAIFGPLHSPKAPKNAIISNANGGPMSLNNDHIVVVNVLSNNY